MVSASSSCLHTLLGIFEASGSETGALLSTINPGDSVPHALRKDPPNYHDVAAERIVPHCLDSVGIRNRHGYLGYLKTKLPLILIIIYLIRFKKMLQK